MGTIVNKKITIQAPVAEVWAYIEQIDQWSDWYVGLHSVGEISGPNVPGTTYVAKFDLAGVTTVDFAGEVLISDPGKRWKGETKGMIDSISDWTYENVDGSTLVHAHVDYTVKGSVLGKIADKLFVERQTVKDLEKTLKNLQAHFEAPSLSAAPAAGAAPPS